MKKYRDLDVLLTLLDEAFVRKSWHGTTLRGSIRGLTSRQAAWSPGRGRKSIWEHVVHAAYWKYTIRRRILGEKRGSFPLSGSNWFGVPRDASPRAWKEAIALLEEQHRLLRNAVAAISSRELDARVSGSKLTNGFLIRGIALHDIYHTGQIQFIKRMMRDAC
jgi:uncharacterized damage-inducible protein DinB